MITVYDAMFWMQHQNEQHFLIPCSTLCQHLACSRDPGTHDEAQGDPVALEHDPAAAQVLLADMWPCDDETCAVERMQQQKQHKHPHNTNTDSNNRQGAILVSAVRCINQRVQHTLICSM